MRISDWSSDVCSSDLLATGIPIAFGLGLVALGFLIAVDGLGSLGVVADTFFGGLADFALVSIPMFVLMGAAVASSPAGKDLYAALDRWLHRVPGGQRGRASSWERGWLSV